MVQRISSELCSIRTNFPAYFTARFAKISSAETHAISFLKNERAEMAGQINHLYAQAELPCKKVTTKSLFQRNEVSQSIFDQLRASPGGLLTPELAEKLFISKGWGLRDKELLDRVKHRFGTVQFKHAKRGVRIPVASGQDSGASGQACGGVVREHCWQSFGDLPLFFWEHRGDA